MNKNFSDKQFMSTIKIYIWALCALWLSSLQFMQWFYRIFLSFAFLYFWIKFVSLNLGNASQIEKCRLLICTLTGQKIEFAPNFAWCNFAPNLHKKEQSSYLQHICTRQISFKFIFSLFVHLWSSTIHCGIWVTLTRIVWN